MGVPGCPSRALDGAGVAGSGRHLCLPLAGLGVPQVAFRDECWLADVAGLVAPPHRTPWPSVGSSSFAPVLRGAARRWGGLIRDGDWCVGSLSTWSRVAAGLPEQQMVAAWGPAIRPSGRLFTRRHDDRKVSEKIPCDSRVELVGLGAAQEGGLGGR